MDKTFWTTLAQNDYQIPAGYSLAELRQVIFSYLGNPDPELRDDIAYMIYANWLKRGMFSKEEVWGHVNELLENLKQGLGETESDSVFLRAFSVLFLAEIVHNDNKKPFLEKTQIQLILSEGLSYLAAEKDPRGHIPVKGWAHALAHTADLLMVLGRNSKTDSADLEKVLTGIAAKLVDSTNWVYIHGEDERLVNAVMMILGRDVISVDFLKTWLKSLTEPERSWNGAYMDEAQAKAFHNVRNFLRSLLVSLLKAEELTRKEELQALVIEAVTSLTPY